MKKSKVESAVCVLAVLCAIMFAPCSFAEQRSMDEVMNIAGKALKGKKDLKVRPLKPITTSALTVSENTVEQAFYLVEPQQGEGFVLVSSDDRMPRILGFSDNSNWCDQVPDNLQNILQSYNRALELLNSGTFTAEQLFPQLDQNRQSSMPEEVPALLDDIAFNQTKPYNNMCPSVGNAHTVTGCVATAMAQIFTYYKYPKKGTGVYHYGVTSTEKVYDVKLDTIPFDWNLILHSYKGSNYTAAQAKAVARLMYACGVSIQMEYDFDGSSAHSERVQPALVNVFGYDKSAQYVEGYGDKRDYSDWVPTLQDEFIAGRPVYFAGAPGYSGHAFVIDGYKGLYEGDDIFDSDGYVEAVLFHVNWGWGGDGNGHFYLNNLNPDGTNYAGYRSEFVFGIKPPKGSGLETVLTGDEADQEFYTVFGMPVPIDKLQPGTVYVRKGQKVIIKQ
ncbi:MAG: C10 family peptidase [Paludibacteraceae bacterium]|nr:C10 family peptidase [Paludibacteraceae bacterium]